MKKFLSIILTILMVVTMIPMAVMPASAAENLDYNIKLEVVDWAVYETSGELIGEFNAVDHGDAFYDVSLTQADDGTFTCSYQIALERNDGNTAWNESSISFKIDSCEDEFMQEFEKSFYSNYNIFYNLKVTRSAGHSFSDWTDAGDGTHTRICSVCSETETQNHSFDGGNCLTVGKCVCGLSSIDSNVHTKPVKYVVNSENNFKHDEVYECCGVIKSNLDHKYDSKGMCKECKYQCAHSSFTDSICDYCGYNSAFVVIDGTLGGKTTATEDDVNTLVEQLKGYVDSGITTIIVTGSEPALYYFYGIDTSAVSAALYYLADGRSDSPYCGTIDLILPDVTEIVDDEFNSTFALNSITLPKVTTVGDGAFYGTTFLQTLTFGSVITFVNEKSRGPFHMDGYKVGGCDLVLNCGQLQAEDKYKPNFETNVWFIGDWSGEYEWKSITLTHTEGTAATYTDNGDGTHSYTCACGATVVEVPHTLDITTGKCSACGADMTVIATVTDSTNTYYAADAATLNQAVTAILETGSRTFTVELPADTEAEMITAIRRAICDTEGVADGSINLTLKGVTSIPGTTNWDGVAFGPGDIYDEAGEIVDQELVTQLASINLPDATEIGAQAFYVCENLVSVSAPKAQTIGENAFAYTALTSVEFPELTAIPGTMLGGTWTLSSAKFPKVTTIEQNGLMIGFGFAPENNPTAFPLELTAEGDITFNGSNHFNIASQNYSGKVDLVLNIDKKDQVTFNDDGTATWQVRDDLSYTFKSITFTCTDGTTNHSYTDGICTNCGEVCPHEKYTDGVCDKCGYECPHESYTDGKCDVCGYECTHESITDNKCDNCGTEGTFVTIEMTDSYGDGWNGNAVVIKQLVDGVYTDTEAGTATIENGGSGTFTTVLPKDGIFALSWLAGGYPSECSFTIAVDGETVYECADGSTLTDGQMIYVTCEHTSYTDGKCDVCGYECPHKNITDGKCDSCGYECPHENYTDGKCDVCGYECPHENYTDGKCDICGIDCPHENITDGKCDSCGTEGTIVTIDMTDSYGDGWNGNAVVIKQLVDGVYTDTEAGTATIEYGAGGTFTTVLPKDGIFALSWLTGDYPEECSFTIAVDGETVYECADGRTLTDGQMIYVTCEHTSYTDGKCDVCGYECPHKNITDGKCDSCGTEGTFVTIDMTDSYGNGWNGNAVVIKQLVDGVYTDTEAGTATIEYGVSGTFTTVLPKDGIFALSWLTGDYPEDCSFTIAVDGETVYECADGSTLTDGQMIYVTCEHTSYTDSKCDVCGYECTHESYTDSKCDACGYICTHEGQSGSCQFCGANLGKLIIDVTDEQYVNIGSGQEYYDEDGYIITGTNEEASVRVYEGTDLTLSNLTSGNLDFMYATENSVINITLDGKTEIANVSLTKQHLVFDGGETDTLKTMSFGTSGHSGSVTVNGGNIDLVTEGGYTTINCFGGFIINGGTVTAYNNSTFVVGCEVTLNGGELNINSTSADTAAVQGSITMKKGTLLTFNAESGMLRYDSYAGYIGKIVMADGAEETDCFFVRYDKGSDFVPVFDINSALDGKSYAEIKIDTHEHSFDDTDKCICGALLHRCDFSGEWKYDAEKHWKECTSDGCDKISEEAGHTYTDGKCDCGYACPHEKYTDGVCDKCGYECPHTWDEDGYCRKCKTFCKHENNVNGVCTVCDCVLTFSVITGDTVSYYDSFDDALENAEEGSTVKLMKGIEQIASYEINKAITFDLNGNNWDTGSSDYIDVNASVIFTDSVGTGNLNLSLNLYAPCLFNSGTYKGIDIMFETEDTLDDYLAECHGFFDHYTGEFKDVSDEKYVMGAKVDIYHKLGAQTCKGYQCEVCGEYFGEADPDAHDWSNKDGICVICGEECAHAWDEGVLTRPVYDAVLGSKDGYYTYTCAVCGEEKTETVKSADYSAYEAVSEEINGLLQSDDLTPEAKQAIYSAANECGLLSNDLMESEQNKVDSLVAELEKIIAAAEEKIASGEYVKADYTAIDEAIKAVENKLASEYVTDEGKAELEEIKTQLEEMKADTNTSKADLAELETALDEYEEEIDKGIEDGTLVKFSGERVFLELAEEAEKKIDEKYGENAFYDFANENRDSFYNLYDKYFFRAASLEGGTMAENAENTEYIKGMVDELFGMAENCLAGTHNYGEGVLTRPTFETAGYYTYTCTLCGHSYTEPTKKADTTALNDAYMKVTEYFRNDTLTQEASDEIYESYRDILRDNGNIFDELGFVRGDLIEEDQPLIDAITAEFEKIIADADEKIASGEYVKADYTAIDEAIDDIEEKLASENVTDEGKAELEEIKKQLEEMKADENTSAADVAELEKALSEYEAEVDEGIADGSAVKVDGLAIINELNSELTEKLIDDHGKNALEEFYAGLSEEAYKSFEDRGVALFELAASLTGSVKENEEKIAELKAELHEMYTELDNCLNGTHNGLEYTVTEEAKCGVNAIESATCTLCGETDEREVEGTALEHVFGKYTSNGDATCTADGTKTAECIHGCGATDTVADEGSMIDHSDEDGDKLCDDCQAEIIDTCPDCGRPAHEDTGVPMYICIIISFIRLVISFIKAIS